MATEIKKEIQLEIAHVLFIDIVAAPQKIRANCIFPELTLVTNIQYSVMYWRH